MADADEPEVRFTAAGLRRGAVSGLPLALAVAGYGLVFGVLASRTGLSAAEAGLMSATVLAGAAQFVAVELWAEPVPVAAVVGATLVVNLRYLLMGAALRPWFGRLPGPAAYASLFFVADENWALTLRELRAGREHGAFLLGSGLAIWAAWVLATVVGALAGGSVAGLPVAALDFVLTAVLLALLVGLWEGRSDAIPWLVALAVAVAAAGALPGRWYVLAGGLAGSLAEVVRHGG